MDWYQEIDLPECQITIFSGIGPRDLEDDNVDVEVNYRNGIRYVGTLATLRNIKRLMERAPEENESFCQYFWCKDLVVVKDLRPETIVSTVQALLEADELGQAFQIVEDQDGDCR
ncbi:MAG: hypothetical protein AAF725_08675 [Acidobacteriota bacterium]